MPPRWWKRMIFRACQSAPRTLPGGDLLGWDAGPDLALATWEWPNA